MVNTDIGLGTDPERLEQHILNKKRQVLDRKIFATCQISPGLSETVQTVHTITEESQLSNGKKIDFGIAGGFEGVQLGFEVANETSDWSHNRRIIAIADLRYQWAATSSRIYRNKLYKFLTKDCKEAVRKINGGRVTITSELSHELSSFIGKYGTHVVLECTHGYRMEKVERMTVKSDKDLQDFKADIMASVLGYAGIHAGYQQHHHEAGERTDNFLGIKNIGSKEHMKEAIEGGKGINFGKMIRYSSEGGDAGVISHDWNMMIAEMLLAEKSYETAAKRLQYWTQVRINDLKAGWNEGLFATAYKLKCNKTNTKKIIDSRICVTIGGRTVVHQHPGIGTDRYVHVTKVHTNEAISVQISVLDDELKLKDVLAKITVFRRVVRNLNMHEGVEGLGFATEIDTGCVDEPENQWELFDLSADYDWEPAIERSNWKAAGKVQRQSQSNEVPDEMKKLLYDDATHVVTHVVTIGNARAKVCRGGLEEEEQHMSSSDIVSPRPHGAHKNRWVQWVDMMWHGLWMQ